MKCTTCISIVTAGKVYVAKLLMSTSSGDFLHGGVLWYIGSLMKHQFTSSNSNLQLVIKHVRGGTLAPSFGMEAISDFPRRKARVSARPRKGCAHIMRDVKAGTTMASAEHENFFQVRRKELAVFWKRLKEGRHQSLPSWLDIQFMLHIRAPSPLWQAYYRLVNVEFHHGRFRSHQHYSISALSSLNPLSHLLYMRYHGLSTTRKPWLVFERLSSSV